MKPFVLIAGLATLGVGSPNLSSAAMAQTEAAKPDVATLLFGNPQWAEAPVGSTIVYAYSKKTADAAFGTPLDDTITLKLEKGDTADSRLIDMRMFTGVNAKPAGPFPSGAQNPVLLVVLEENVQELAKIFKANPLHFKNAIRTAWRDDAKIENVPVSVNGKMVPGTRITVTPFTNDSNKDLMKGLDAMVYTVEIADSVPGNIASIDIHAPANGKPIFSETLHFQSETKP